MRERAAFVALLASFPLVLLAPVVVDSTAGLVAGGVALMAVGVIAHVVGRTGVSDAAPALWTFGLLAVLLGLGLVDGAVRGEPWKAIADVVYWAAYAALAVWAFRVIREAR